MSEITRYNFICSHIRTLSVMYGAAVANRNGCGAHGALVILMVQSTVARLRRRFPTHPPGSEGTTDAFS